MAKVINNNWTGSVAVVPDDYGELRPNANGSTYIYMPIPYCRVPYGATRNKDAAEKLAQHLADYLTPERVRTILEI